jgi:hypothetical protein
VFSATIAACIGLVGICEALSADPLSPGTQATAVKQMSSSSFKSTGRPATRSCRQPSAAVAAPTRLRAGKQRLRSQAVSRPLEACQEHDVVQITTPGGVHEWLEVMQGWNPAEQSCQLLWRGQLVQLAVDRDSNNMELTALGGLRGDWVPMHVCLLTSKRSASL